MGRQQSSAQQVSRPKRKATNAHIFRYLQTRNPSRLEENDLRKALEASLEDCPDIWTEDTASCSSSEQSNAPSAASSSSSSRGSSISRRIGPNKRRAKSSMQQNHHNPYHHHHSHANPYTANPNSTVHNRYKPVAKKNIYNEADFFHDGIMEYIEYELTLQRARSQH